jgi:hypothetical protein
MLTDVQARSVVRDLDPCNDLTFLRVRSLKTEILVAPGAKFVLKKLSHYLAGLRCKEQMLKIRNKYD